MNENLFERSVRIRVRLLCLLSFLGCLQASTAQVPRIPDGDLGGTVTAITADQASIKTESNEQFTIVFAANTTFFKQIGTTFRMVPAKVTDIHVGGSINVIGHLDPDGVTKHAKNVMIVTADTSRKLLAHGGVGISQVSGKITAIDGMKLTIARYDNVPQVIEVNDQTVFIKGAPRAVVAQMFAAAGTDSQSSVEAIRFTDLKTGDVVITAGALKLPPTVPLKDNIFLASKVAVQVIPDQPNTDAGTAVKH